VLTRQQSNIMSNITSTIVSTIEPPKFANKTYLHSLIKAPQMFVYNLFSLFEFLKLVHAWSARSGIEDLEARVDLLVACVVATVFLAVVGFLTVLRSVVRDLWYMYNAALQI